MNISLVAAWRFYCALHPGDKKVTHLEFRIEITLVLMKSSGRRIQSTGERHANLPKDVRYDGQNHEQTACSQGRCRMPKECKINV